MELIGRRWSGAIIFLLLKSTARFADLRAGIPGITDRMLSERLHELESEGICSRTVIPDTPVRVEYALTVKGQALAQVIDSIGAWAHDWTVSADPNDTDTICPAASATDSQKAVAHS